MDYEGVDCTAPTGSPSPRLIERVRESDSCNRVDVLRFGGIARVRDLHHDVYRIHFQVAVPGTHLSLCGVFASKTLRKPS